MVVVTAILTSNDGRDPDAPRAVPSSPSASPPLVETKRYVNRRGGYRFALPKEWRARSRGATTDLKARGLEAAMSMGPISGPSLRSASGLLLGSIRDGYRKVKVTGTDKSPVGDLPARTIAGTAVNMRGAELRFLVIAVGTGRRLFGINVFAPESSNPAVVLPSVQTIVSSFVPIRPR